MWNQTDGLPNRESNPALGAVYICLAMVIMATNGIIIYVTVQSRHLQIPTLHILTGIGVTAFVSGLHLILYDVPLTFFSHLTCDNVLISFGGFLAALLHSLNMFQVMLAVLDRYIAVCHPLRYTTFFSGRNILCAMLASVGLCLAVNIPMAVVSQRARELDGFRCVPSRSNQYFSQLYVVVIVAVPVCVIAFSLIQICREFKRRIVPATPMKFPWLITCFLAWGTMCYLPSIVVLFFDLAPSDSSINYSLNMLRRLSCFMNIFIFTGTFKPFREQACRIFCSSYNRRQRQNSVLRALEEHRRFDNTSLYTTDVSVKTVCGELYRNTDVLTTPVSTQQPSASKQCTENSTGTPTFKQHQSLHNRRQRQNSVRRTLQEHRRFNNTSLHNRRQRQNSVRRTFQEHRRFNNTSLHTADVSVKTVQGCSAGTPTF